MLVHKESSAVHPIGLPAIPVARSMNKLLASLPLEDYQRIQPHLKSVALRPRQILYKQDAPIDGVYFPIAGACALVKSTEDGHTTQIAGVGAEGAIGASVFFGLTHAPCDAIVQMTGSADVLPTQVFMREMDLHGSLYNCVIRYSQTLMMELMQWTACNGLHSAAERCARWLLAAHDRAGRDEFAFTHEFAATMLGLRRPTVTIVSGSLQAAGLIKYRRGFVTIVDRAGLEAAACECYRTVKATYRRLMPEHAHDFDAGNRERIRAV